MYGKLRFYIFVLSVQYVQSDAHDKPELIVPPKGKEFLTWISYKQIAEREPNLTTIAPNKTEERFDRYSVKGVMQRIAAAPALKTAQFSDAGVQEEPLVNWWQGPNVCEERIETTMFGGDYMKRISGLMPVPEDLAGGKVRIDKTVYQLRYLNNTCQDFRDWVECETRMNHRGILKIYTTIHKCCPPYERAHRTNACVRTEVRDLMNTIRDMEAISFINMLENEKILSRVKKSVTVFVPMEQDLIIFSDNLPKNHYPTSGKVGRSYSASDVAYNHIVQDKMDFRILKNNQVFTTYLKGSTIRMNIFPTSTGERFFTANCVPVQKTSVTTLNGIIHVSHGLIPPATQSIVELITGNAQTGSFKLILGSKTIKRLLLRSTPYTLLLPSDEAYKKLDKSIKTILRSDNECSKAIINNHIIPKIVCVSACESALTVKNADGAVMTVEKNEEGKAIINGQYVIIHADIIATNGIIHIVDSYILPTHGTPLVSTLEKKNFTKIREMLRNLPNIEKKWSRFKGHTLFLPSDKAFMSQGSRNIERVDRSSLEMLLQFYVSPKIIAFKHFINNMIIRTELAESARINLYATKPESFNKTSIMVNVATWNCALLSQIDINTCGNVIHAVDNIVFPQYETIYEILKSAHKFNFLLNIMEDTDIIGVLKNKTNHITFFAPTEKSFMELRDTGVDIMVSDKKQRQNLLFNHILHDVLCCSGIALSDRYRISYVQTYNKEMVEISRDLRGQYHVGSSVISECDIVATNGVIHFVDGLVYIGRRQYEEPALGFYMF